MLTAFMSFRLKEEFEEFVRNKLSLAEVFKENQRAVQASQFSQIFQL